MTPFIHSVTISSSLPLFFCPLMAHMHLSVFLPNGIFKLWAYGLTSYLVSGACGRNCPTTNSGQGSLGVPSDVITKGSLVFWAAVWCVSVASGPMLPGHRSDCSSGKSLKSFILKSMLTGDDMMEMGLRNWLCPLSLSPFTLPLTLPLPSASLFSLLSLSHHSLPSTPPSFLFSPSLLLSSSLGCVEHKMSDYFPADTALCDSGLEDCISLDDTSSASPISLQTTSNIARPFWSLKRLVLGEEPVLKQKQTKCFICHVCQWAICAA